MSLDSDYREYFVPGSAYALLLGENVSIPDSLEGEEPEE